MTCHKDIKLQLLHVLGLGIGLAIAIGFTFDKLKPRVSRLLDPGCLNVSADYKTPGGPSQKMMVQPGVFAYISRSTMVNAA